jgi:hypothetical protein
MYKKFKHPKDGARNSLGCTTLLLTDLACIDSKINYHVRARSGCPKDEVERR